MPPSFRSDEGVVIYTDGASRKNPGPASCAFIIVSADDEIMLEFAAFLGDETNNVAEYSAIIEAFTKTRDITKGPVKLYSDSQLAMRQLTGVYKISKPHLAKMVKTVRELENNFISVSYHHVPRENRFIRHCDALCNFVLDQCS